MRIGIVNDLRLAVESLRRAVAAIPGAAVAWVAEDGAQAVACCARDRPDVVLMDMIMPVMDGVEATRRIMRESPCPILVVTATVEGNAGRVFEALGAGALDAVATPGIGPDGCVTAGEPLLRKIRTIALLSGADAGRPSEPVPAPARPGGRRPIDAFVAIGASTGGPQALATVLQALPRPVPWPVVVVQHVDPAFAPGLADWLSRETGQRAEIARGGETPAPGRVLIAATADHLVMDAGGGLRYSAEPRDLAYRPSVDVFFDSVAAAGGAPGAAALLTGMGRDGAAGLGRLRAAGWHTIAQDEATSVVWGMPAAAVACGAAREVLPIQGVGPAIARSLRAAGAGARSA
jgi:two-component system response regulator WspF